MTFHEPLRGFVQRVLPLGVPGLLDFGFVVLGQLLILLQDVLAEEGFPTLGGVLAQVQLVIHFDVVVAPLLEVSLVARPDLAQEINVAPMILKRALRIAS